MFDGDGELIREEGVEEGVPAPVTPVYQADPEEQLQLEADAAAAHASKVEADRQLQEDEDARELMRAEQEEVIAQAAIAASAKQNAEEWTIESTSQQFKHQQKLKP